MNSPFKNCSEDELDIAFTLLVSTATGADPWTTENTLKERGLIGRENRSIWDGGDKF